jgi:electron transport complex protein RnfG
MTATAKNPNSTARLIIVLFLISAITALCLGLVNYITKDRIAEIKAEKTAAAMEEVLPADSYEEVSYTGGDSLVAKVYKAGDAGYVVEVLPSGFGGAIDMMVGVDASGTVTGVSIIDMSETSGLGANASKEEFRSQFVGATGSVAVTKDGGTIDALTGATVTSRAVSNGVNAALNAVASLG